MKNSLHAYVIDGVKHIPFGEQPKDFQDFVVRKLRAEPYMMEQIPRLLASNKGWVALPQEEAKVIWFTREEIIKIGYGKMVA